MLFRVTALIIRVGTKPGGFLVTARVPSEILLEVESRLLRMIRAVVNVCSNELFITISALKLLKPSKHLPEDLLPSDLLLPQVQHELVDVPMLISHVL